MKILFDVTPAQKKKILEILKLTAVVDVLLDEGEAKAQEVKLPATLTAVSDLLRPAEPLRVAEGTSPVEPDGDEPDGPQVVTREEVADAVLTRAKMTTSSDAISILERVGGCPQLSKIEPEHYAAVLAALQAVPGE